MRDVSTTTAGGVPEIGSFFVARGRDDLRSSCQVSLGPVVRFGNDTLSIWTCRNHHGQVTHHRRRHTLTNSTWLLLSWTLSEGDCVPIEAMASLCSSLVLPSDGKYLSRISIVSNQVGVRCLGRPHRWLET